MAVYKRAYRPYEGPLTAPRWRFLVLPRFSLRELSESRVLTAFMVLCLVPILVETAAIYIANSPAARALLRMPSVPNELMRANFFFGMLTVQGLLAVMLTAWVSPVLVAPDLANGALPLYLSRPFSRGEYVLGKGAVLVAILSAITWLPGLFLFGLQAGLAGPSWLAQNLRIPWAIVAGSWIWIAVLTLLGLAVSAAIRWKYVASGAILAVFFMGMAFGAMWGEVLRNSWGRLANLTYLIGLVWRDLFMPGARVHMSLDQGQPDLPTWVAGLALLATSGLCVWVLNRRLRAREVVA
jgi:ABC-2 type transport system permease protein